MSRRNSIMVQKAYYQMGIVTLFTVLLWVSISVYLALVSPSALGVDPILLTPVNAKLDEGTLASISARTQMGIFAPELVATPGASVGENTESSKVEVSATPIGNPASPSAEPKL